MRVEVRTRSSHYVNLLGRPPLPPRPPLGKTSITGTLPNSKLTPSWESWAYLTSRTIQCGNVIESVIPSSDPTNSIKLPSMGMTSAKMIVRREKAIRNTYSQNRVDLTQQVENINQKISCKPHFCFIKKNLMNLYSNLSKK